MIKATVLSLSLVVPAQMTAETVPCSQVWLYVVTHGQKELIRIAKENGATDEDIRTIRRRCHLRGKKS